MSYGSGLQQGYAVRLGGAQIYLLSVWRQSAQSRDMSINQAGHGSTWGKGGRRATLPVNDGANIDLLT